jgi:hypothetical protein
LGFLPPDKNPSAGGRAFCTLFQADNLISGAGLFLCFKAGAAINGPAVLGLEGNLGFNAAVGADYCEGSSVAAFVSLALLVSPAVRAALGLVLEAFLLVKFLLAYRENELVAAVLAGHGLVGKTHRLVSFGVGKIAGC